MEARRKIGAKRKQFAVFKVRRHRGEKVFVFGDLLVDQVDAYNIYGCRDDLSESKADFRVFRKGEFLDSGIADIVGGHAPTVYFSGLRNFFPKGHRFHHGFEGRDLSASLFKIGDEVRFNCKTEEVRERIIKEWHDKIMFSSAAYAEDLKRARAKWSCLIPTLENDAKKKKCQKEGDKVSLTSTEEVDVLREADRLAYEAIYARLAREPIPEIIRFCRSKLIKPNKDCP